jgi:hypothetical protein
VGWTGSRPPGRGANPTAIHRDPTLKQAALAKGASGDLYDKVVIPLNLTRPGTADLPAKKGS